MGNAGDWVCGSCNHLNFYWRQSCRSCQDPRPQDSGPTTNAPPGPRVFTFRPGDWFCDVGICKAHNFASRSFCFKCGALKSMPSFGTNHVRVGVGVGVGYYNHPVLSFGGFHGSRTTGTRINPQAWKPGDWFCSRPHCYAHNYASRVICFKCKSSKELVTNASN